MLAFTWYLIKVLLCSGILFGYYWVALRNKKFHHYNRFYLLISVAISWIIPLLKFDVVSRSSDQPQVVKLLSVITVGNNYVESTAKSNNTPTDWNLIAMLAFATISLVLLTRLLIGLFRIKLLINTSIKQKLEDIYLVFSNAKGTPFSFFKYIFWNENIQLESPDGQHILKHELAHVKEHHSADKLFLNLSLVAGWYNPIFWLIKKEISIIHEFIADEKAIKDGDTAAFASMILNTAYSPHSFALSNPFFYSPLKRRLLMLTSSKSTRFTYIRRVAVLPLLLFTSFIFAFHIKKQSIGLLTNTNIKSSLLNPLINITGNSKNQSPVQNNNEDLYDTQIVKKDVASNIIDTTIKTEKDYNWPGRRVILDGERMTWKEFEALNIPKTEFITAIFFGGDDDKSKFAARFGDEAKNALAIFTTKKIYEQTGVTTENGQKVIFTKDESGKITTYTKDEAIVRFGFRPSDINHWFSQGEGAKSDTSDKEKFDKIFTKVETPPTYNGPGTLIDFVKKNMRYPADASYKKIDGRVVIKFVVNEEGELKNFTALSSVGGGLEEEAIRLIKASGIWKPAVQNGRKVPFEMIQEIDFKHPQKSTNGFIESLPKSNLLMKMNKGDGC